MHLLLALLLVHSPCRAELIVVQLQVVKAPPDGWKYVVKEGDTRTLKSDAELGTYLKGLSNPRDSIFLTIESEGDVPIDQLGKILALAKANRQGITVKTIVLDTKGFNKLGPAQVQAGAVQKDGLSLSIRMEREVYAPADEIALFFRLKNETDRDIFIGDGILAPAYHEAGPARHFEVLVIPAGDVPLAFASGQATEGLASGLRKALKLKPGEAYEGSIRISAGAEKDENSAGLSHPDRGGFLIDPNTRMRHIPGIAGGKYLVALRYCVDPKTHGLHKKPADFKVELLWQGTITSKTVQVEVLGKKQAGGERRLERWEDVDCFVTRDIKQPGRPIIELDFIGSDLRDAELKKLATVKSSLTSLNLRYQDKLTDSGFAELECLDRLETLFLPVTNIGDVGLRALARLRNLQELNLSGTRVTDAGLMELAAMKKLRWLGISQTAVSDSAMKQLQNALPECKIAR
jgi:hypothetical protein